MKILVDADACPVVSIVEQAAKEFQTKVILLCDTSHIIQSEYSQVKVIDSGADAVDFALIQLCSKGDIVVTQDYGVAAMALGKGAYSIHQSGKWYTKENIDGLPWTLPMLSARRTSPRKHGKGPRKRKKEDDDYFRESFRRLLHMTIENRNTKTVEEI